MESTNRLDRLRGWEAESEYESRFLRKCTDGGYAGTGHRHRAVGNQDFPRCVSRASWRRTETSFQEEARDKGIISAAAEAFSFSIADASFAGGFCLFGVYGIWLMARRRLGAGRKGYWFRIRHARWLLFDDRSTGSHGSGSSLRTLSTGHVSLTRIAGIGSGLDRCFDSCSRRDENALQRHASLEIATKRTRRMWLRSRASRGLPQSRRFSAGVAAVRFQF